MKYTAAMMIRMKAHQSSRDAALLELNAARLAVIRENTEYAATLTARIPARADLLLHSIWHFSRIRMLGRDAKLKCVHIIT